MLLDRLFWLIFAIPCEGIVVSKHPMRVATLAADDTASLDQLGPVTAPNTHNRRPD